MSAARRRSRRRRRREPDAAGEPVAAPSRQILVVPLALTLGLFLLSAVPRIAGSDVLVRSFWGAAAALLIWQLALFVRLRTAGEA